MRVNLLLTLSLFCGSALCLAQFLCWHILYFLLNSVMTCRYHGLDYFHLLI